MTAPARPAVPTLTLLSLSDSFSNMWPALATECGLGLASVAEPAGFQRLSGTVGLVAAGGAEGMLEGAVREAAGGPVVLAAVGALPDHRLAAAVVRAGAADYFALPGDYELLRSWLRARAEQLQAQLTRSRFAAGEGAKYRFEGILGESVALVTALDRAARVIPHPSVTVLLTGETGTGKELLARAIHYNGPRREQPFVDVNCAAIPDNLLESELFGHEKGAFTGAHSAKPGLFEMASGGTLFLDEIAHLALPLQGKLLRALEERAVRRVGGTRTIPVDVRVIAATHVNLGAAVQRGAFREDLYYRLNVVPIELPPLRARRADIVPLARHFIRRFAAEYGVAEPALTMAAERALTARDWRGNVRELRNAVERALLLSDGRSLDERDFAAESPPAAGPEGIPFPATLREVVHGAVEAMVELSGGNKSEAARRLRISRPRLQRLLESAGESGDQEESDA